MNKEKRKQRNFLILVLLIAYISLLIVFAISLFRLPGEYTELEKNYASEVQTAITQVFETARSDSELKDEFKKLVEKYPMELIVDKENNSFYRTTSQTAEELLEEANSEITLLQAQKIYEVGIQKYNVFYNVYHIQGEAFLTHLTFYQILLIAISILIILSLSVIMMMTLFKTLTQVKESLYKVENFEFEDVINQSTNDEINEKLRLFVQNLNHNIEILSRDFTELEQALKIEQERLENTINVSSAFVHDLKSPLHQLMLTNERMQKKQQTTTEVVEMNVEELEKIITTVNEILKLMNENIYDLDKKREVVDIIELLNSAYKMFLPIVQKKEIYFELDIPEQVYTYINVPTIKLLIHNILSNATQYASEATEVICGIKEKEETFVFYCINETTIENLERIKNSEHLFSKNLSAIQDDTHQYSSGKGLFLIKELAHALDGEYRLTIEGNSVNVEVEIERNIEIM